MLTLIYQMVLNINNHPFTRIASYAYYIVAWPAHMNFNTDIILTNRTTPFILYIYSAYDLYTRLYAHAQIAGMKHPILGYKGLQRWSIAV